MKEKILQLHESGYTQQEIADDLKTSRYQVIKILKGITTYSKPSKRAALTTDQAKYVIKNPKKKTGKQLAKELGVSYNVIMAVCTGRSHTYLSGEENSYRREKYKITQMMKRV